MAGQYNEGQQSAAIDEFNDICRELCDEMRAWNRMTDEAISVDDLLMKFSDLRAINEDFDEAKRTCASALNALPREAFSADQETIRREVTGDTLLEIAGREAVVDARVLIMLLEDGRKKVLEEIGLQETGLLDRITAELNSARSLLATTRNMVTERRGYMRERLLAVRDAEDLSSDMEALVEQSKIYFFALTPLLDIAPELLPPNLADIVTKTLKTRSDMRDLIEQMDLLRDELKDYVKSYTAGQDPSVITEVYKALTTKTGKLTDDSVEHGGGASVEQTEQDQPILRSEISVQSSLSIRLLKARIHKAAKDFEADAQELEWARHELFKIAPKFDELRSPNFEFCLHNIRLDKDLLEQKAEHAWNSWMQELLVVAQTATDPKDRKELNSLQAGLGLAVAEMRERMVHLDELIVEIESSGKRDPEFQRFIESWDEKVFDATWLTDKVFHEAYKTWQNQPVANDGDPVINAEAIVAQIDNPWNEVSELMGQGTKEAQKWLAEKGVRKQTVRCRGSKLVRVPLPGEPQITLKQLLSRMCAKEVSLVEGNVDRLKTKMGIKPATQAPTISRRRGI